MRFKHNIQVIRHKLVENFKLITQSSGYAKAKHLLYRATILREHLVCEIQNDLQKLIDTQYWVATDNKGSGFDTRYAYISWMDTR